MLIQMLGHLAQLGKVSKLALYPPCSYLRLCCLELEANLLERSDLGIKA